MSNAETLTTTQAEAPRAAAGLDGTQAERPPRWKPYLFAPLLALYALTVLLVPPVGDFPLNDDWVYAKVVETLLEEGEFRLHPYAAANMLGQALIGALFTAPFGLDFTALRVSTICLGFAGAWATAHAARAIGLSRGMALLCGTLLLWNPILLNLTYTFMTDVPFTAFTALGILFYLRALKTGRLLDMLLGSAFAAYAFLIRQFGIVVPAAFLLALGHRWFREGRRPSAAELASFAAPWVVAVAIFVGWQATGGYQFKALEPPSKTLIGRVFKACRFATIAGVYMGLFTLPITIPRMYRLLLRRETWSRGQKWIFGFFVFCVLLFVMSLGITRMPLLINVLRDLYVGPLTMPGIALPDGTEWKPQSIGGWWWVITVLCVASGGILVADAWGRIVLPALRSERKREEAGPLTTQAIFLLFSTIFLAGCVYNPWVPSVFDRYLAPAAVPACLLAASFLTAACGGRMSRAMKAFLVVACAGLYVFSLLGLQEYMAWNRARWTAIDRLNNVHGIEDKRIKAGYEFNGLRTSDLLMEATGNIDFNAFSGRGFVIDDEYVVAMTPLVGFDTIDTVPYRSWLGGTTREIYVLHRRPEAAPLGKEIMDPAYVPLRK